MEIKLEAIQCPDEILNFGGIACGGHVDKAEFAAAVNRLVVGLNLNPDEIEHTYGCSECGLLPTPLDDHHRAISPHTSDCELTTVTTWCVDVEALLIESRGKGEG